MQQSKSILFLLPPKKKTNPKALVASLSMAEVLVFLQNTNAELAAFLNVSFDQTASFAHPTVTDISVAPW